MLISPFDKMKKRIITMLSLLLVIAFIVISYTSYIVAHNSLSYQLSHNTLPLTGDNIYSEIQRDLLRPIFISSLMAQDTFVRNWIIEGENNEQLIVDYLSEIQTTYDAETSFFVSEKSFKYYHSTGVLKTVSENDEQDNWYYRARSLPASEKYEINIDVDTANNNQTVVYVNYKVKDFNDQFIGLIGIGLTVNKVRSLIEKYQQKYNRSIYFTNKQGLITLHGSAYTGAPHLNQSNGINQYTSQILSNKSASLSYQLGTNTVYFDSRYVPEFKWYLIVEQNELEGQSQIMTTLWHNIVLGLVITFILMLLANRILSNYQNKIETLATTDTLTKASTRQVFDSYFKEITKNNNNLVSLIILDIDDFKQVNDQYGHNTGDNIIKAVSDILLNGRRDCDLLCRWGGEEFILLLPKTTLSNAYDIAERLRVLIASNTLSINGESLSISASFGVAEMQKNETQIELINRADQYLYNAKNLGKNRVEKSIVNNNI
jgi:diguanylate cyclase (GGDEF)-like protein